MTQPENPPKLWAFYGLALDGDEVDSDPLLYAYESEATAREAQEVDKSHDEEGIVGAVQAYVREDVAEAAAAKLKEERDDAVREHRPFEGVRDFLLSQMVNLLADRCAEDAVDFVYDELHALDGDDLAVYQAARAEMPAGNGVG